MRAAAGRWSTVGGMAVPLGEGCVRCGGPVVVDAESVHPGGVTVQHGRCPVCGIALRRLLDAARLPLSDVRGGWTAADVFAPTVASAQARPRRARWPGSAPRERHGATRPAR